MTQNYYCSTSPDNRLSVTAVMVPVVPSTINRGTLNETIEIPKLLHTMRAKPALCDPFETQDPGMNMSWETEQNKCDDVPTLDLIAARM